ncbi:MAG: hypothetical protein OEV42_07675 [Deltaproteobacteria bacterium]|nr:hypothetical protein [Deltaproteobacteria bacterium]
MSKSGIDLYRFLMIWNGLFILFKRGKSHPDIIPRIWAIIIQLYLFQPLFACFYVLALAE